MLTRPPNFQKERKPRPDLDYTIAYFPVTFAWVSPRGLFDYISSLKFCTPISLPMRAYFLRLFVPILLWPATHCAALLHYFPSASCYFHPYKFQVLFSAIKFQTHSNYLSLCIVQFIYFLNYRNKN